LGRLFGEDFVLVVYEGFFVAGTLNNNMTSDYVKQELRATVGARMQQQSAPTGVGGQGVGGGPQGNPVGQGQGAGPGAGRLQQPPPQHLQQLMSGQVQQTELSGLGLSFEMTPGKQLYSCILSEFGLFWDPRIFFRVKDDIQGTSQSPETNFLSLLKVVMRRRAGLVPILEQVRPNPVSIG